MMSESKAKVEFSNGFVIKSMELRDYFAARAMQSYWSDPNVTPELGTAAAWAYEMADAMLKARQE